MAKTIGKVAAVVGAVALIATGVGAFAGTLVGASVFGSFGAASAIAATAATVAGYATIAAIGLSVAGAAFQPKASPAQLGRLQLTFDPDTFRKMLFGSTAGATDVLYTEPSGTDQEYIDYIVGVAAHEIDAIESIQIDDKLLWSSTGGIGSTYTGYATVTARAVGTAANAITINSGTVWSSSNCRLTGCAYIHVRLKRTGNSKKAESPFAGGISGRWTIICRGAKVYDPRLDSTRGGSGSHRADDQTTWDYTGGNNHALQALSFILGYRIGGVVSVGVGYPVDRIDYADWITAANICDEAVSVTGGGTQKRYEGGGLFSDADNPASVLALLCTHMHAELRDVNGKIGIRCAVNDFSGTLPALTADDVLGEYTWTGFSPLNDSFDTVKGKYIDPSAASLYQPAPYTPESLASSDIPGRRIYALDLPLCQDPTRAQRIARQVLRREQYRGTFSANFGPRAWAYPLGTCITLTFAPAGLSAVKFRIISQGIKIIDSEDAAQSFCPMTLQVEDAAIYSWSAGDAITPPAAVAPVSYDALNGPLVLGIADSGETALWPNVTGTGRPDDNSTPASNLQINARLTTDATGYNFTGTGATRAAGTNNPPTAWVIASSAASWGANQVILPLSPVSGGRKVFIEFRVLRTSTLSTMTFAANVYNALTGSGIGPIASGSIVPTTAGAWQSFKFSGTVNSEAGFIGLTYEGVTGNGGQVEIADATISYSESGADVTALVAPDVTGNLLWEIEADFAGTVTTALPSTRRFKAMQGNTDVSSTSTWVLSSVPSTVALTVNNTSDRGLLTLGTSTTTGGACKLSVTFPSGTMIERIITLTKTNAAAPITGGSGATTASDTTFTTVSSGSFATISDELQVRSDGASKVRISVTSGYRGAGADVQVAFRVGYATTSGGSLTNIVAETNGTTSVYDAGESFQYQGAIYLAETQYTLAAANTDYFFKLESRRVSGSGDAVFEGSQFLVRQ